MIFPELPDDKNFKGVRVLIFGLGVNGGGVESALYFARHGALVTVTDLKSKEVLSPSLTRLSKSKFSFSYTLGEHKESDIRNADLIIQNPGIPSSSPFLTLARKKNIPIHNVASVFFRYWKGAITGITGTRGKSTTTLLTYHMLKRKYPHTFLAGTPHTPLLAVLDKGKSNDHAVMELSSWQCEFLKGMQRSPHYGVITNIFEDHLNRYDGMNSYADAKWNMVKWQTKNDYAILNYDSALLRERFDSAPLQSNVHWISLTKKVIQGIYYANNTLVYVHNGKKEELLTLKDIKKAYIAQGDHNIYNLMTACMIARLHGVSKSSMRSVAKHFMGLPGRQEHIATKQGVEYYNDTTSTTPIATENALLTLAREKKVILIAGGEDKNLTYDTLASHIKKYAKSVILLPGSATIKLERALRKEKYQSDLVMVASLKEAVESAHKLAHKKDSVVFSPAAASFNLFLNEFDRGAQFTSLVHSL